MSFYQSPQEALIYQGNYESPYKSGELRTVFADVAGSSENYRVMVRGYNLCTVDMTETPQDLADSVSSVILDENLQDNPDIHAVADAIHRTFQEEFTKETEPGLFPFDAIPAIITLHKPGKFQSAEEILNALSLDERNRYKKEVSVPEPQNS